jgi:hypothetical protein
MMNRADVRALMATRGRPAVSIVCPTHRTAPANAQDPIRLRGLIGEARDRIIEEYGKRDAAAVIERIEQIGSDIDHQHTLDTLVIMATADESHIFHLPVREDARVIVDETFYTRPLVRALNRTPHYHVLVLSEQPTRLFEGFGDAVVEVRGGGFPLAHGGPGDESRLPDGWGVNKSAVRDEHHRRFFSDVGARLSSIQGDDPRPVVLLGVPRYLAFARETAGLGDRVIGTVEGSYDRASAHEISQLTWPVVEAYLADRRSRAAEDLAAAVGTGRFASTLERVWQMAVDGRVDRLMVEKGYSQPGTITHDGRRIRPTAAADAPGVVDDLVDECIEAVIERGGEVVFVDDGTLTEHGRIGSILRY